MNKRYVLPALVFMVIAMIITACIMNPVTGKKQVSFMSESQEIALGKESDPIIVAQFGLYEDPELQQFISAIGKQMAAVSHRPHLEYEFKILDSPIVNAFAVPGGYIYFTRGIMAHFNNEAQFAGVLGHEIGHITARHSAQQYTKQMIAQLAFMGGMIVSERFRDFAYEAMQGMELLFLKFSRDNESESDLLGVQYSSQIGYDAREMSEFFETLDRMGANSDAGRIPEFLSTHPDPGRREVRVAQLAEAWQDQNNLHDPVINENSYLRMLDGMVYGEDPRQGYVKDAVFYHPELKFLYPIPPGWDLQNSPIQVQMAPKNGKALMLLTLADSEDLRSAAQSIKGKYGLRVKEEGSINVNGLEGYRIIADYPQQDAFSGEESSLWMQTVLIRYNDLIYVFHGLCEPGDQAKYQPEFNRTMTGFRKLTDDRYINVSPERIRIIEAGSAGTLGSLLASRGYDVDKQKELALLNGMETDDPVGAGQLIKIVD